MGWGGIWADKRRGEGEFGLAMFESWSGCGGDFEARNDCLRCEPGDRGFGDR